MPTLLWKYSWKHYLLTYHSSYKEGLIILFYNAKVFKVIFWNNIFLLELHQRSPTNKSNFHSGLINTNDTIFLSEKETHTWNSFFWILVRTLSCLSTQRLMQIFQRYNLLVTYILKRQYSIVKQKLFSQEMQVHVPY